jgi:hypothetical protein
MTTPANWPPPAVGQPAPGPAWGQPVPSGEPILTRTYRGKVEEATAQFQVDAAILAQHGYVPISQIYAPGSWGAGAFIIALILLLFVVGILVLLYLLMVKPAGSLTVTYQLQAPRQTQ